MDLSDLVRTVAGFCDQDAPQDAIGRCGQFNIMHQSKGLKIGVIAPADRPGDREQRGRG